jgi:hypothetical protein
MTGCTIAPFSALNVRTKLERVRGRTVDVLENLRTTINYSKCEIEKEVILEGEVGAEVSEDGELVFTEPPEEGEVKLGGESATLTGDIQEETEGGEGVRAIEMEKAEEKAEEEREDKEREEHEGRVDLSLTLAGGYYPVHLEETLLGTKTKLSTASESLKGEGVLLLLSTKQLAGSGTFELLFTKVKNSLGVSCNSAGDPSGEVLTKGTFHLVYTSLSPLALGILVLLAEAKIECGEFKIKVKGSSLSSLNAGSSEASELTEIGGQLKGSGTGKPSLTTYYNVEGKATKAKLEANFGSGFVEAAEEVEAEFKPKALESKMFVITGR